MNNEAFVGGGIYNTFYSLPNIINCSVANNKAYVAGGMINDFASSPTVTNCSFTNNEADSRGGGIDNYYYSSPTLTNCTIADNRAKRGGALHNDENSSPKLRNTIIFGNSNGVYSNNSSVPVITYSLVQGITSADNNNISGDTDPLFVDPANGDYRLQPCSPIFNKGNNSYYNSGETPDLSAITTDLAGEPRFANNGTVDMGAYEITSLQLNPNGIFYVKAGAKGHGGGWECPTGDLQAAINAAASGQQVWVAGGTYQPASGQSFIMKEGVKIYGGFAGTEQNLDQRDLKITSNASILRGNGAAVVSNDNNGLTTAAVLDGFTVTGGSNANRYHASGNGIYNKLSSPTFTNLIVSNNVSITGGGIANYNSSPVFTNCFITDNNSGFPESSGQGGGMYNYNASPTLINCSITGNDSNNGSGGGMDNNNSNPILINCLITDNTTGIGAGGGVASFFDSHPTLTNCLISNNTATNGGAMYNNTSSPILTSCTIINNIGSYVAGICNLSSSFPKLRNTIVYGNSSLLDGSGSKPDIKYSLVEGENNPNPEDHNIAGNVDPLFVNSTEGDYRLNVCSPVINKGNNSYYNSGETPNLSVITTDLAGDPRFYDNGTVDMGAYEFAGIAPPSLAVDDDEADVVISGDYSLMVNGSSCTALAFVSPNGTSPLSGEVTAKVWVETTQPSNFLKRHYEITPTTGAETATAKVTLYFTQQEFTDFNAVNSTLLPVDPEDTDNHKANLLIEKRSGVSSDGSGLPGTYDGSVININPSDPSVNGSVVWNGAASRWEVSFDVTGFSGFFAKTTGSPLPLNLISFTGSKETGSNLLQWSTTSEVNTLNFEVQGSVDAKKFIKIGTVNANGSGNHQYRYNDVTTYYGNVYYRLKMIDGDGTFAYSKIISLKNDGNQPIVYPNPANASITINVNHTLLLSTATLYNIAGTRLQNIKIISNQQQINVTSLTSGVYILKFADGTAERFVKD